MRRSSLSKDGLNPRVGQEGDGLSGQTCWMPRDGEIIIDSLAPCMGSPLIDALVKKGDWLVWLANNSMIYCLVCCRETRKGKRRKMPSS